MKISPLSTAILCTALFIVNTVFTFISNLNVFGKTNSEVSAANTTVITPAGWAFSIWGLIFAGEGAFCVFLWVSWWKSASHIINQFNGPRFLVPFATVSIMQPVWSVSFAQEQIVLSTVFLWAIWAGTLGCYIAVSSSSTLRATREVHLAYSIVGVAPFTIHLGWATAAAVLNINLAAVSQNAALSGQLSLAIVSLLFVTGFITAIAWIRGDWVLGATAGWAFTAIATAALNGSCEDRTMFDSIVCHAVGSSAAVCAAVTAGSGIIGAIEKKFGVICMFLRLIGVETERSEHEKLLRPEDAEVHDIVPERTSH